MQLQSHNNDLDHTNTVVTLPNALDTHCLGASQGCIYWTVPAQTCIRLILVLRCCFVTKCIVWCCVYHVACVAMQAALRGQLQM